MEPAEDGGGGGERLGFLSGIRPLRNPNPMAGAEALFLETLIPQQKTVGEVLFPAVLSPKLAVELDLHQFTEAMKGGKPPLEALLRSSGALLLRGYPVRTTADFDRAVEAFGYEELPYVGGAAPRTNVVGRVFTANESSKPGPKIVG